MYLTGQNCNGEYIMLMNRDELNDFFEFRLKQERRRGYIECQEDRQNNDSGVTDDF